MVASMPGTCPCSRIRCRSRQRRHAAAKRFIELLRGSGLQARRDVAVEVDGRGDGVAPEYGRANLPSRSATPSAGRSGERSRLEGAGLRQDPPEGVVGVMDDLSNQTALYIFALYGMGARDVDDALGQVRRKGDMDPVDGMAD